MFQVTPFVNISSKRINGANIDSTSKDDNVT